MILDLMPVSSAVEQGAVNSKVEGSNPSLAAIAVPGSAVDLMCAIEGVC